MSNEKKISPSGCVSYTNRMNLSPDEFIGETPPHHLDDILNKQVESIKMLTAIMIC
jgi:hypothetical protein